MRVLWAAFAIVVVDQIAKVWVRTSMLPQQTIPVVGRLFRLTYTENPGMAFGLSLGSKLGLTLFALVATAAIAVYLWYVRKSPGSYRLALALVLGGAVGNIIDRVFYGAIWQECLYPYTHRLLYGCVVDFIHVDMSALTADGLWPAWVPGLGGGHINLFPIGNIADLSIIAGVVLIMLTQKKAQATMQDAVVAAQAETPAASLEGEEPAAPTDAAAPLAPAVSPTATPTTPPVA